MAKKEDTSKKTGKQKKKVQKGAELSNVVPMSKALTLVVSQRNARQHAQYPDLLPLDNVELRYAASLMKHIIADIEVVLEARTAGDRDYENAISDGIRQNISDLKAYIEEKQIG